MVYLQRAFFILAVGQICGTLVNLCLYRAIVPPWFGLCVCFIGYNCQAAIFYSIALVLSHLAFIFGRANIKWALIPLILAAYYGPESATAYSVPYPEINVLLAIGYALASLGFVYTFFLIKRDWINS